MGLIICDKHGIQGIRLVCREIYTPLLKPINPATQKVDCYRIVDTEIGFLDHILCSVCLPKFVDEDFENVPVYPVCGACFKENFVIVATKLMPYWQKMEEANDRTSESI